MVEPKDQLKKFLLILNHDRHQNLLEYDPTSGDFTEITRPEEIKDADLDRGFYIRIDHDFIGVFASTQGPVLFINQNQYVLNDRKITLHILEGEQQNTAKFFEDQQLFYVFQYPKVSGFGVHWGADEEFMDFLVWLAKRLPSERFYQFYTV